MKILAIDTSTEACSVALLFKHSKKGRQVLARHEIAPKQHASIILPIIHELVHKAGFNLAGLDAIAFGCGPGSLTGIRIAASVAQGIAYANDLPVIPVSSLAAAAQAAYTKTGWNKFLVAVDARMEQIYWGGYEVENGLVVPAFAEELVSPHGVKKIVHDIWYGIGDGWNVYREQLEEKSGIKLAEMDTSIAPTAESVLTLATVKFEKGDLVEAADALPVYLR